MCDLKPKVAAAFIILLYTGIGLSYQISVYTDKIVYTTNETINISGTLDTNSTTTLNISIYNSSSIINSTLTNASNGTFSVLHRLVNASEGNYSVLILSPSYFANVSFRVVEYSKTMEARLLASTDSWSIATSKISSPEELGGNFTDIFQLNKSGVYYGNATISSTTYHFLLIDQNYNGYFDTMYIDDDKDFLLYNYTEDSTGFVEQQSLRKGSFLVLNGTNYFIAEINASGTGLVIAKPVNSSVYSPGQTLYFFASAKTSGNMISNYTILAKLSPVNSTEALSSVLNVTNTFGYFTGNFTAPAAPGVYKISVNDEPGEMFFVETFSLKGMITDETGNPTYAFTPNPSITIKAVSKNSAGELINLDSCNATLTYPNGSSHTYTLASLSKGIYSKNISLIGQPNGQYRVKIIGASGGNRQEFSTGFSVEAVRLEIVAFNPQYIDMLLKGGLGFEVSAFAPNRSVTIMAVLSNVSAGGLVSETPAVVDIDDPTLASDQCSSRIQLVELKDEVGNSYINSVKFNSTNISSAFSALGIPQEVRDSIPYSMNRQCVLTIEGLNRTGIYRAKIKVDHPLGTKISGVTFSLQKLYATGDTVDIKGEDFSFFAPNETMRIKLKITNLSNNRLLDPSSIINAKIISMQREFPSYEDAMTSEYLGIINESISNGTLSFTTPLNEGFYTMKFRFATNFTDPETGLNLSGIGSASFMLKKYIIWAELQLPENATSNNPFVKPGQNITLTIRIADVSEGSKLDMGMSSSISCTGCEGLVANVSRLFNDQLMKDIPTSDYTIIPGTVLNSTSGATITIVQNQSVNLSTGWYGLDIELYNPENYSESYFGWGGFEVRNFFVETIPLEFNGSDYIASFDNRDNTFEIWTPVLFGVVARNPSGWEMLPIPTAPSVESVFSMNSWPPPKVYYNISITSENVAIGGKGQGGDVEMWVVNLTHIRKFPNATLSFNDTLGNHQAIIRVSTQSGSDVGTFFFDIGVYQVDAKYRGMEEWPAKFAQNENFTINFSGMQFDGYPHELSNVVIKNIFSEKQKQPIRVNSSVYGVSCIAENCTLNLNLSAAGMTNGRYGIEFLIYDAVNFTKTFNIDVMVTNTVIAIPSIERANLWFTDTALKEIDLEAEKDWCLNEKWLKNDEFAQGMQQNLNIENNRTVNLDSDVCLAEPNKVCIFGNNINFTFSFTKSGSFFGIAGCLFFNGTFGTGNFYCNGVENGTIIGLLTNGTDMWINSSGITLPDIGIIESARNHTGDNVSVAGRNWTLTNIFRNDEGFNRTEYIDRQLVITPTDRGSVDILFPYRIDSQLWGRAFCVNSTFPQEWGNDITNCPGEVIYIVSNSTHIWINNNTDMTGQTPKMRGDGFVGNGMAWKIVSLGTCQDGSFNPQCIMVTEANKYNVINISGGEGPNILINVSGKYARNYAGRFCIRSDGEWYDQACSEQVPGTDVYVVSNATHIGINTTPSLMVLNITNSSDTTFFIAKRTWNLTSLGGQNNDNKITLRLAGKRVCGTSWANCNEPGCEGEQFELTLAKFDNNSYYGYRNLVDKHRPDLGSLASERYVYIYHNTTHLWMSNSTNLSSVSPAAKGQLVSDPYGGIWNVTSLNKRTVKLTGVNVLASTGMNINVSFSKTGRFKIGLLRESELGAWNRESGQRVGLDINGNSLKNDTLYIAVSDNHTAGIYDTLFVSPDGNFTNPAGIIPLRSNRTKRTFGSPDALTLLNIPPRADSVLFYSRAVGDWSDLGEYMAGNNITIPVIVRSPSGQEIDANVSVPYIINERTRRVAYISNPPNTTISGSGELQVGNSSYLQTGSAVGEFSFGINVTTAYGSELLEDWKLPRATTRAFLTEISVGKGGWISGFAKVNTNRYDMENYPEMPDIFLVSVNGVNYTAFTFMQGRIDDTSGCHGELPIGLGGENATYYNPELSLYFLVMNRTVWFKPGDCNFSASSVNYTEGQQINITKGGKTYMLYLLYANSTQGQGQGIVIGPTGIDSTAINPIRYEMMNGQNSPRWKLMSLNIGGVNYSAILANDTSSEYPMCSLWHSDCVKKIWLSSSGNFSQACEATQCSPTLTNAVGVTMGQNFTEDLYLAKIGPGPWDGIVIANFSEIGFLYPNLPLFEVRTAENPVIYFGVLDESTVGMDLDFNISTYNTYYVIAFDEREDGQAAMTNIKIDDDTELTDDFWGDYSNPNNPTYKDFTRDENGMKESQRTLPNSIYTGSIIFGSESEYHDYENKPEWEIVVYNNTDMLIQKRKWLNAPQDAITAIAKVYNFNQTPIAGSNLSISKITRFTNFGPQPLTFGTDYIVTQVQNVTDSYGYGILKVEPMGEWVVGEYMITLSIQGPGARQTSYQWFRIEPSGGGQL